MAAVLDDWVSGVDQSFCALSTSGRHPLHIVVFVADHRPRYQTGVSGLVGLPVHHSAGLFELAGSSDPLPRDVVVLHRETGLAQVVDPPV